MRLAGDWAAFEFVLSALAAAVRKAYAYLLLVAMLLTATYLIGLLDSVLLLPKPVIALDAISESKSLPYF